MGFKDTITKDYMADNCVFADIFNHMIYQGEYIIEPDQLHEIDTASISVPYGKDGAAVPFQNKSKNLSSLTEQHLLLLNRRLLPASI